jgi:hypothetical protein
MAIGLDPKQMVSSDELLMSQVVSKERRYAAMKSILVGVLIGAAVLLGISACATVPTEPLGEGELRLLKMRVSEMGLLRVGHPYKFIISFEADGHPEIIRALCFCSGRGPYPYNVQDVTYGSEANFTVYLLACQTEAQAMKCSVDYVRNGKRTRSNFVSMAISAY